MGPAAGAPGTRAVMTLAGVMEMVLALRDAGNGSGQRGGAPAAARAQAQPSGASPGGQGLLDRPGKGRGARPRLNWPALLLPPCCTARLICAG